MNMVGSVRPSILVPVTREGSAPDVLETEPDTIRQDLIHSLGDGLEGVISLAVIIFLMFGMIGLTCLLLGLLRRETPRVALTAPKWGGGEVLLGISAWFLLQLFFGSLAHIFVPFQPDIAGTAFNVGLRPRLIFILSIGGGALSGLIATAAVLALPRVTQQPWTVLGLGTGSLARGSWIGFLAWLCFIPGGLALTIGWSSLLILSGVEPQQQPLISIFGSSAEGGDWALLGVIAVLAVIVAPIAEEFLFRVLFFRWVTSRAGLTMGIVVSALVFGLIHMNAAAFLPITALGALLAAVYHHTGNVWTCIALHSIFNGTQLLLLTIVSMSG